MADLPKYEDTGTISVANGATAVTGVGTIFNVLPTDCYLNVQGLSVRIASVTDNTHLTLAEAWPGTTLSGDPYEIAITYDGPQFQLRARQLLEDFSALDDLYLAASSSGPAEIYLAEDTDNGTSHVTLKSASSLAANRTVTFPDASITFSSFIATLLDDADAATALATLGIATGFGSWTPVIIGTTSAGSGTYGQQSGRYATIQVSSTIKIVFFIGEIIWSAHTGTGNMKIDGLPYANSGSTGFRSQPILYYTGLTFAGPVDGYIETSATTIQLETVASNASSSALPMDTAAGMKVSGFYFAAA